MERYHLIEILLHSDLAQFPQKKILRKSTEAVTPKSMKAAENYVKRSDASVGHEKCLK